MKRTGQNVVSRIPSISQISWLRRKIIHWFRKNKRSYPWRKTTDPFKILIAEMMLQRTKADQVRPVYNDFFSSFKSPEDIASASMKKLDSILYPLGLRWRIKKIREVSRALIKNFDSRVPDTRCNISRLPGVGDYVAGIVLSTAFNKKEWVVDSNIVRVFKRYFGIDTSREGRRDRHVVDIARTYASCKEPGEANLAILDFTALICTPKKPECSRCPVSDGCYYFCSNNPLRRG